MKKIFFISFVLLLDGCSIIKHKQEQDEDKSIYIEEFKFRYFTKCLYYGFNSSKEIIKILQTDRSGYGEYILGEKYFLVDSLAQITAKKMVLDSLNSIGRVAEGSEGKHVFSECLCNYNSKWLNARAKLEYKEYKKDALAFKKYLKE